MPTVHLERILKDLGTNSVRELFRRTGSSENSVFKQAQIAAIDRLYQMNREFRGPFGFPLDAVEFTGNTAIRSYSGGQIKFLDSSPQGEKTIVVRVRFVGFRCISESSSDQLSGSDEPYFIIGVASAKGSKTKRFGHYEGIDSGSVRFEADDIVSVNDEITPPIVLGVVAMEHDFGSEEEAEAKVREVIEAIERKFDQAVGSFSGATTENHVLPEWARDILIGWIPEGIAALFGLADDQIGKTPVVLFDNKADLKEFRAPAVIGQHGANEYNVVVNIDGGDEGKYDLFLRSIFSLKMSLFSLIVEG
jgi:hypothetical protein